MNNLEFLDGRVSIRNFDSEFSISDEEINSILEHAANAPSGNNFQPWKVLVVKNKEKQKVLSEFSFGQKHVADASAVFLLYGDKEEYNIDRQIQFEIKNKILELNRADERRKKIELYFSAHPEDKGKEALRFDVGLFSMNLMHVVRAFGYDSVPMRGTQFDKIKEFLDVTEDWEPILMLPVGKALKPGYPHVRKSVGRFARIID